jgi:hypothetical protein
MGWRHVGWGSIAFIRRHQIVVPNKSTQLSFEEAVMPLVQQIKVFEQQNQHLTELRDWLLPMPMDGQVTIAGPDSANSNNRYRILWCHPTVKMGWLFLIGRMQIDPSRLPNPNEILTMIPLTPLEITLSMSMKAVTMECNHWRAISSLCPRLLCLPQRPL